MANNKFNLLRFIIGTIMMFFTLIFTSLALYSPLLCIASFVIAPVGVYFFNRHINLKRKNYYGGLIALFIATFIFAGVNISNYETPTTNKNVLENNEVVGSNDVAEETDTIVIEEEEFTKKAKEAEEARLDKEAKEAKEAKKDEEAKLAKEAKKDEEAKLAKKPKKDEEAMLAKEAKLAEEARIAEETRLAEEARIAEETRLTEEARIAEEVRRAEQERLEQEAVEQTQNNVGEMVWITETGKKYHRINNCGNTNSANARQITLEKAKTNYEPCKKCY